MVSCITLGAQNTARTFKNLKKINLVQKLNFLSLNYVKGFSNLKFKELSQSPLCTVNIQLVKPHIL